MDPVTLLASVTSIAQGAFQVIAIINQIREGGRYRLRLLTEINALWMVLKLVELNFEPNNEGENKDLDEAWLKTVRVLNHGSFPQVKEALGILKEKLEPPQNRLRKAMQTLRWPFDKAEIDSLVAMLARLKDDVNLALTSTSATMIRDIHEDMSTVKKAVSNVEEKALLDWLSMLNFLKQQQDFVWQVRQGTGEWFLDKEAFKHWLLDEKGILWCPGIPGAGKTFLASIVFERLKQNQVGHSVAVLIAYCGYNEAKSQSIDNLITALIRQVAQLQPIMSEEIKDMYKFHSRTDTFPTLSELTKLLRNEIAKFERCFIVLDALDEILDEPKRLELLEILIHEKTNVIVTSRRLDSIAELFATNFVICDGCKAEEPRLTYHCRQCEDSYGFDSCESCHENGLTSCGIEDHYLSKRFSAYTIDVEATQGDVRNYVQWRIDRENELLKCISKKRSLREDITDTLVRQSKGMFLLARLHLDALSRKRTPGQVQQALQNLPTQLKQIYESAMERIATTNEDDRKFAMNLLQWLAFSARPLSADEVEHATPLVANTTSINRDEIVNASDLTSLCAGLVIIDASNILRLVHFSAQTFLEEHRAKWFPNGHMFIAKHCLTYLCFKEFENGPLSGPHEREEFFERLKQYPLLQYASTYWGFHASRSDEPGVLTEQALAFLQSKTLLHSAVQVLWYTDTTTSSGWDTRTKVDPLHLLAYSGLSNGVAKLLGDGSSVDCRDSMGTTPLMFAATGGHTAVAQILLRHGANTNLTCERGTSALSRAIVENHVRVTRILLEEPGLNLQILDGSKGDKTPLMLAASLRCSTIIATLLQKPDLDINASSGSRKSTALSIAASTGDAQIVRQLLSHPKIDVNKRDSWCTPLTGAASLGFFSVVEALLDHGADPEIQEGPDYSGGTPLNRAIDDGYISIVRLLLQRGANAKVLDSFNRTVIHSAAVNGRTQILKLLFEAHCDVDINAQGTNGRTALHDAAYFDYHETIEVLYENGARTDIRDNANRSPLGVAKDQNNFNALRLLTKYRKEEELRGEINGLAIKSSSSFPIETDDTSLLTAAKLGLIDIVQANITYAEANPSFDINIIDLDHHSALHYAIQEFHDGILSALVLAKNIDLNIQDRLLRTPLHWTAMHNNYSAAVILLNTKCIDVIVQDHFEQTALSIALHSSNDHLVVLLMRHGAWPRTKEIQQALCVAAVVRGGVELCERLVREGGADPGRRNADGEGPFHLAEHAGNVETARAILRLCEEREEKRRVEGVN